MEDKRPKRRKDKYNPYTIYERNGHYYVSFEDGQKVSHMLEINKILYKTFDSFELDDLVYLNVLDRHIEQSEVWESTLNGPVLVIQNNRGNRHSPTVIVAAVTSRPKHRMSTHVPLKGFKGLEKDSVVLLEQMRTIDKKRLDDYVGALDRQQMRKVEKALCASTGMRKLDKPILMCLCTVCAKPFYESKEYYIRRADRNQKAKETCMFCNVRQGYDYSVRNIISNLSERNK